MLQITDSHLRPNSGQRLLGVDTAESLRAVLAQAFGESTPQLVVASGDLAHDPEVRSYRRFLAVLREFHQGATLFMPGNHDLAVPLARTLPGPDSIALGDWEVVGFDSHADDRPEAELTTVDLAALQDRIAGSTARHLLLACHHPLVDVGCPWLDKDRIKNGGELLEWCVGNARVRGVVFGHVHQVVERRYKGITVLGTPSTCFQFAPGSARFAIDETTASRQPGYRWLELQADGTIVSVVRRVTDYPLNIDLSDRD